MLTGREDARQRVPTVRTEQARADRLRAGVILEAPLLIGLQLRGEDFAHGKSTVDFTFSACA